jgi:outer membrane protein
VAAQRPRLSPRRLLPAALLLLAAACGTAARAQVVAPVRAPVVGFVVLDRLFVETRAAREADIAIKAEFAGRASANQALFARLRRMTEQYLADEQTLDEPERTRRRREVRDLEQEAERKEVAYRDELVHRTHVERDRIVERASLAIAQIARQDKLDVVLFRGVLWARPGSDITDKLIRLLDQ